MILGYVRGKNTRQQRNLLENYGIDELFSDEQRDGTVFTEHTSDYSMMLNYAEFGDEIVISSFEVLSRDYQQLIGFIKRLEEKQLTLTVLNLPRLSLIEFKQFLEWTRQNERFIYPQLTKIGKDKKDHSKNYSIWSRDPEAKALYRSLMLQMFGKYSLKALAQQYSVPLTTVYRIKQEVQKIKLMIVLVVVFILALFSTKITEQYFDEWWIQVLIGLATTLLIVYNILADNDDI